MKPIQSSPGEAFMDLASLAGAKPEATPAASFQTVFAMALQSLVTPAPTAVGIPPAQGNDAQGGSGQLAPENDAAVPGGPAADGRPTAPSPGGSPASVAPMEQPVSAPMGRAIAESRRLARSGLQGEIQGAASGPEPMPSRMAARVLPAAMAKAGTAVHPRIPVAGAPSPHPAASETNRDEHEASGAGGVAPGRPDDGNRELAGQAGSSDQATPVAVAPAVPALVVPAGVEPIAQADGSSEPLTHERPAQTADRLPVVPHMAGQPRPRTVPLRGPAAVATEGSDAGSVAIPHDAGATGEHAVPGQPALAALKLEVTLGEGRRDGARVSSETTHQPGAQTVGSEAGSAGGPRMAPEPPQAAAPMRGAPADTAIPQAMAAVSPMPRRSAERTEAVDATAVPERPVGQPGPRVAADVAKGETDAETRRESAARDHRPESLPAEPARAAGASVPAIPTDALPGAGRTQHPAGVGSEPIGASRTAEPDVPVTPQPTDRVTVHLPDEAGGGRIQIAVRGDVVHARLVGSDELAARRLEDGLGDLRGALARQGFQEAHVRVDAAPSRAAGWAPAAAAEPAAAGDSRQSESDTPEREARDQRQHDPRSDPRQQHQGRSQQRARRERER